MAPSRYITFLAGAAAIGLTALSTTGCGGGGSGANATAGAPKTTTGASATVGVATTGLGKVLVDSRGQTIYLFKKDTGTKSACSGACAVDWPPVRATGEPRVAGGARASLVATTRRADGKAQVTYNGHPLYLFAGDRKPGDTNGQGLTAFGAAWYALSPAGGEVSGSSSSSSGSASNSGGGGGY